jgi:DAK2 domain fusion protein YloV
VAYKGVNRPVEGTILTVVREAAAAAENAAELDPDLPFVLERTLRVADESVANTPKLLPVLAQANKVDAGGKGLYYILEGIYRALAGEAGAPAAAPAVAPAPTPRALKGQRKLPPLVYGFDVQFLVEGQALDVEAIRERITAMGDCPLVEGDEHLVKVHIHVPDPGVVLSYAVSLGFITDVVVENMDDMQMPEILKGYDPVPPRFAPPETDRRAEAGAPVPSPLAPAEPFTAAGRPSSEPIEGPAIVTVAPGVGLGQVFLSLGAHKVVPGGQTMNPSTQELLQAIENVPSDQVIILPNNGNIIMAAQQTQALTRKSVAVVPSKSVPQGISALLALNPRADLDRNVRAMTAALEHVQTGEVTVAVHQARFLADPHRGKEVHVQAGDVIGLLNDELSATGPTSEAVVKQLLEQMGAADLEIITLYYGQPVTAAQAQVLQAELHTIYPDQEFEIVEGNQPFYHYIISAE